MKHSCNFGRSRFGKKTVSSDSFVDAKGGKMLCLGAPARTRNAQIH
jgi:hypothetical protein